MNYSPRDFINFFYWAVITTISLQCSIQQITDLPSQYRQKCYKDIYDNKLYDNTTKVMMQVYKFFSQKNLAPETIQKIFSLCCTKPFFSRCNNKNCEMHDSVLNRGLPEFPLFKIVSYIRPSNTLLPYNQLGFKIILKEERITEDSIKKTFIKSGLTDWSNDNIKIISTGDGSLFVNCIGSFPYNSRNKVCYNNSAYICKALFSNHSKRSIIVHDMKEQSQKTFSFDENVNILNYYCADGLLFITLVDEHARQDPLNIKRKHDCSFPIPQNHRLEIYDIESKLLLHTQKLPLPKKHSFDNYDWLLDYADSTGYYLYYMTKQTIHHYIKTSTFDIN